MTNEEIVKQLKRWRREINKLIREIDPSDISAQDDGDDSSNPGGTPPPPPGPPKP